MADDYTFHVDRTAIMLFASALGETNRIYYDEAYAGGTPLGGVVAPPTFAISSAHWDPTYALKGVRRIPAPPPAPEPPARSGGETSGQTSGEARGGPFNLARVLHGEQRFEYHKPMRPGMALRVTRRTGKSWEKQGKRGGKMRFVENVSEYRDAEGELVVTATSVGITTEKAVES
ncbi:MAG: MaoC family dehydratase N-terminal domain-containing protein [Deltaproteobacteria bacterium]|nr:MAG: MaoC family dehydratase N-terminal domain-containing protein [Deltaproteobacteria bacterium]